MRFVMYEMDKCQLCQVLKYGSFIVLTRCMGFGDSKFDVSST